MNNFIDFSEYSVDGKKVYNENVKQNSKAVEILQNKDQINRVSNSYPSVFAQNERAYNSNGLDQASMGPLGSVLGAISSLSGSIENIIVSFNEVRKEKEKTKQVAMQAEVLITQAKEDTKRAFIHEKQETKRFIGQLDYDYKKFKANLFQIAKEIEFKNNELMESGRKFDMKIDTIKEPIKALIEDIRSKNNFIITQWKQGKYVDEEILRHVENLQNQSNQLMIELIRIS